MTMLTSKEMIAGARQERVVRVPPGLFVLRYLSGGGAVRPVHVAPPPEADASLMTPPGMAGLELVAPGDGLVVSARREVELTLRWAARAGGEPQFALEPVSSIARARQAGDQELIPAFLDRDRGAPAAAGESEELLILAHVARRGDVVIRAGEWLGGPDAPAVIEGLELRWPNPPRGLDVAMRLTVNDHGPSRLPEVGLGRFSGTRRRAAPIIGVDFQLEGRRPEDWVIACDVIFEGQPAVSARGTRIALRGRTGREPLTGLRLSILAKNAAASAAVESAAGATADAGRTQPERLNAPELMRLARQAEAPAQGGRVKIFRSSV